MRGARPPRVDRYTSIIHFHGIGRPRRYKEVSRVLEALTLYAADAAGRVGRLDDHKVGFEPGRDAAEGDPVTFFKFTRSTPDAEGSWRVADAFRLYEIYWSPAAAGGIAALSVLGWLLMRTLHPFGVMLRPWRVHQRLKRTTLNRLFHDRGKRPAKLYADLNRAYRDFDRPAARRRYPRGRFGDFLRFLDDRYADAARAGELKVLARDWRGAFRRAQAGVAVLAVTVLMGVFGILVWSAFVAASLLAWGGVTWRWVAALAQVPGAPLPWLASVAAAVLAALAFLIGHILEQYVSDVVFWTTTLEKDVRYRKRQEIVRAAERMMMHVLLDPRCERVVVLGHSLGTAIAYETLLRLGRRLRAEQEAGLARPTRYEVLRKVSHVVSTGSPIDRIAYFFNLWFSRIAAFDSIADEMMGATADPPFRDGPDRAIRWINLHDRADPIASRLFSPRGPIPNREDVQEVEVASGHFPDPLAAHAGYVRSWLAAKVMYDMTVLGRETLQLGSDRPPWSYRAATALRRITWSGAAAFAWSLGIGGAGFLVRDAWVVAGAQGLAVAALAVVALCWMTGKWLDGRAPLTLRP